MLVVWSIPLTVACKAAGINKDRQDRERSEAEVWAAVWLKVRVLNL